MLTAPLILFGQIVIASALSDDSTAYALDIDYRAFPTPVCSVGKDDKAASAKNRRRKRRSTPLTKPTAIGGSSEQPKWKAIWRSSCPCPCSKMDWSPEDNPYGAKAEIRWKRIG